MESDDGIEGNARAGQSDIRRRRLYHMHHRRAKKLGWADARKRSFWRFWDKMVDRIIENESEGFIDMKEINKMFGWEE